MNYENKPMIKKHKVMKTYKFSNTETLVLYTKIMDYLTYYIEFKCHVTFHLYADDSTYDISNSINTFKKIYKSDEVMYNKIGEEIIEFVNRYNLENEITSIEVIFRFIKNSLLIHLISILSGLAFYIAFIINKKNER
jgi:hypothetical protein